MFRLKNALGLLGPRPAGNAGESELPPASQLPLYANAYELAQPQADEQQSLEAVLYLGDEPLDVVGESHYQEELWAIVGGRRREPVRHDTHAILVPEVNNPYDENAISVWVDLKLVGYLSREDAALYRDGLLRLVAENAPRPIALHAQIVGGGEIEDEDRLGYLGVFLDHDPADLGSSRTKTPGYRGPPRPNRRPPPSSLALLGDSGFPALTGIDAVGSSANMAHPRQQPPTFTRTAQQASGTTRHTRPGRGAPCHSVVK